MAFNDQTEIGGPHKGFHSTQWSELFEIRGSSEDERKQLLNHLFEKYWKPIYFYIRCKGYQSEDAKDLTQDFIQEIILEGPLIDRVDHNKGRFRTFLLKNLDFYLTNKYKFRKAKKRQPDHEILSLDNFNTATLDIPDATMSPDEVFNVSWAHELLRHVYQEVEQACQESSKAVHWEVFRRKVLDPILESRNAPPLKEICEEVGVEQESQASNMIKTVKRIFQTQMLKQLRAIVNSDSEVDKEFNDIMNIFVKA
jgi:hypothetical protein